ncbi:MAG: N-acetylmuramoyl-L-alanine amidase [Ruminococcus sp.]
MKLQQILEDRGYQTVLTRTDNDTAISNKERAEYVAGQGADVYVRIHANGAESSSAAGALTISPPLPILMYPSSMMIPTAFPSAFWMPTVTQPDLKTAA